MGYRVTTNKYGRIGLHAAIDMWLNVHRDMRDDERRQLKELAESSEDTAAILRTASELDEISRRVILVQTFEQELRQHIKSDVENPQSGFDIIVNLPYDMLDIIDAALDTYTDMLAGDSVIDSLVVIAPGEETVTLTREQLKTIERNVDDVVQRLSSSERILGQLRGRNTR